MTNTTQQPSEHNNQASGKTLTGVVLSLSLLTLTACAGANNQQKEDVVFTQLNELLTDTQHVCKQALINVGNDLIGDKSHYLQVIKLPEQEGAVSEFAHISDNSGNNASSVSSVSSVSKMSDGNLMLSGVLEYNDRPSHIRFDAFLADGSAPQQTCIVSYQLDYHFDSSCIAIREEAFKKWNKIGDLGEKTQYYVHKRHPNRKVYLTNLARNTQCLASVRDQRKQSISIEH